MQRLTSGTNYPRKYIVQSPSPNRTRHRQCYIQLPRQSLSENFPLHPLPSFSSSPLSAFHHPFQKWGQGEGWLNLAGNRWTRGPAREQDSAFGPRRRLTARASHAHTVTEGWPGVFSPSFREDEESRNAMRRDKSARTQTWRTGMILGRAKKFRARKNRLQPIFLWPISAIESKNLTVSA